MNRSSHPLGMEAEPRGLQKMEEKRAVWLEATVGKAPLAFIGPRKRRAVGGPREGWVEGRQLAGQHRHLQRSCSTDIVSDGGKVVYSNRKPLCIALVRTESHVEGVAEWCALTKSIGSMAGARDTFALRSNACS